MQTLPQPADIGVTEPAPSPEMTTNQHAALLRWHGTSRVGDVTDALARHPRFPLIECNPDAIPFAPPRGAPRPAA